MPSKHTKLIAPPKANGKVTRSASQEEIDEIISTLSLMRGVLDEDRFNLLMQPPPPHAIRKRPDGYDYLSHGYVTMTLNQIFGFDWDHDLLPVFNGAIYEYVSSEEAKLPTGNPSVTVFGKLSIRVHQFNSKGEAKLVASLSKTGFGGSEVRKKMERPDALKGAQSDSLKVCAARLGPRLGLTMYWNDEAKLAEYEEGLELRKKQQEELAREMEAFNAPVPTWTAKARNMRLAGKSSKAIVDALKSDDGVTVTQAEVNRWAKE